MLPRIFGTAISFLVVVVAYSGYALLVVPCIDPPANADSNGAMDDTWLPLTPRRRDELARIFPPGSWQLNSPTIIETSYGTLLFKQSTRTDEALEIKPCTLLVYAQQSNKAADATTGNRRKPRRRVYVLDAPDGALLEHQGTFNLNQTKSGRIVGGRLLGNISIHSAETAVGANDSVNITTRNIQIDRQRIWTPHEVQFQIGPHHGSGRDLVITLARINNPGETDQRPDLFNTIDSMELIQVDVIHLELSRQLISQGNQAKPSPPTGTTDSVQATVANDKIPVEIRCQGPLQLDLRKQVFSIEKHVDVLIHNPTGLVDQLTCQRLDLHFSPRRTPRQLSSNPENSRPSSAGTAPTSSIEPVKLTATGNPVILRAPSFGTIARARNIVLNIPDRQILLADTNQALIIQDNHQLVAPSIEYRFSKEPRQLGEFIATGPGRYEGKSQAATSTEFFASWQQECRLVKEKEQHLFSLTGDAQISQVQQGTVQADDLHVWFREIPVIEPIAFQKSANPRTTGANHSSGPAKPNSSSSSSRQVKYKIVPQKMAFRGNVRVDTRQLSARTKLVEVWFREPLISAATNNQTSHVQHLDPTETTTLPKSAANSKLEVAGDHIRLEVALPNPQPAITQMSVEGNVALQQLTPSVTNTVAFQLLAQSLQLKRYANGLFKVAVRGEEQKKQPAEIQAGGMKLIGMNIQLDQQIPRIWIDGPGQVHLLQRKEANRQQPANKTRITWEKRLDFNGRILTLEKNVDTLVHSYAANGQLTQTRITGALLQTTLNRYLNLRQPDRSTTLQLKQLLYGGGVRIFSQTHAANGQPISVDQLHVHSMTLDQQTGDLQATGPGWGSSVRVNQQQRRSEPNAGNRTSTLLPESKSGLIYVRVGFENRIEGNLLKRNITFSRNVQTLYGPVPGWNSILDPDPDAPNGLGEQGIELTSDKLKLADLQQPGRPSIVLEAIGNTFIRSKKYQASAHKLSYAQSNSRLTLEGNRSGAKIWINTNNKLNPNRLKTPTAWARKIEYSVDTGTLNVVGTRYLKLN